MSAASDGRLAWLGFVLVLLTCALVYGGLWLALFGPPAGVDWSGFGPYRGWAP